MLFNEALSKGDHRILIRIETIAYFVLEKKIIHKIEMLLTIGTIYKCMERIIFEVPVGLLEQILILEEWCQLFMQGSFISTYVYLPTFLPTFRTLCCRINRKNYKTNNIDSTGVLCFVNFFFFLNDYKFVSFLPLQ